jgi:hypothetical protein
MKEFDIPASPRLIARLVKAGTQGNAIRAFLELITNSDDSYRCLEDEGIPHDGLIELLYGKDGARGQFSVRDAAEGMSYKKVCDAFEEYGAATSGFKQGKPVTGFFGTGAKNALAGMTDGRICTFKDDAFCELAIFLHDDRLKGRLEGPHPATQSLRSRHGVVGDGTIAYFVADPVKGQTVPRFDTVFGDLANHWRLRKIMTNPRRRVSLVDVSQKKKRRRLRYPMATGEERIHEQFTVVCENYGEFEISLSIRRAESELPQEGDDRRGGLLVIDDKEAALDMSLFRYDREPLAARLFGEVRFGRFRELLAKEEPVLDEKREGLNRSHPVCKAVILEVEKRIELLVREESQRQKEARSRIDDEERTRYRSAFKILNEIAEAEAQEVHNLGQDPYSEVQPPRDGFCLYPDCAHITVGKRYNFEVRIDADRFPPGTRVRTTSSTPKLQIVGNQEFKVATTAGKHIMRRYVTVQGTEVGTRATLQAAIGKQIADATVFVEPEAAEKEYLLKYGLVFRPESLTVRMNRTRRALLRVYVKVIEGDSRIALKSDHESVHVWPEELVVNEADAQRHVAEYEVEVWGDEPDVTAIVTAECEGRDALLEVNVRTDEEKERPKGQGMFSGEPHFDLEDPEPLQRTSYSRETGRVTIYANFPSIRLYLGENLRYKKSLAAQILVADLIAERCFFEMARAKKRDVAISPEALPERIQRDAQELSKRHGMRVHKQLVDPALLQKDQAGILPGSG